MFRETLKDIQQKAQEVALPVHHGPTYIVQESSTLVTWSGGKRNFSDFSIEYDPESHTVLFSVYLRVACTYGILNIVANRFP